MSDKLPVEPGWYWATPTDPASDSEREHVRLVEHEGLWYGMAIRNMKSPFIFIREAKEWSDWHGPIVEMCEICSGSGKKLECDHKHYDCRACGGSGRRGT